MTATTTRTTATRPPRWHAVPAVLLAVAVGAGLLAVASLVDAVDDVRGQVAYDRGELDTATRYLTRIDSLDETYDTEWRITEVGGALVPGQVEVGPVPGRSRERIGEDDVTVSYWDGDPVALSFDPAVHDGRIVSVLFGARGAVLSGLVAAGLLGVAGWVGLLLRRRRRTHGWWGASDDRWTPDPPAGRVLGVLLAATALTWLAVAGSLPLVPAVVLVEGAGVVIAWRVWRRGAVSRP
ncbi:hypothetical protein [Nocardioides marinquilinus]|uniref:hypothetical protein n=1 Tax=Nocardioides marinquilinus TaxID=1210400 RepID=UPI0031E5A785